MAQDLLLRVKNSAQRGSIQLEDVIKILSNSVFTAEEGLLSVTDNKNLLLHLAAGCMDEKVLPMVCQAYVKAGLFPRAMMMENDKHEIPIYVAISRARFDNAMLLYGECQEHASEALESRENGWTILHSTLQNPENLNLLKFFLSQERCRPMLVSRHKPSTEGTNSMLPLDLAKKLVRDHEFFLKAAKESAQRLNNDFQYKFMVDPKQKLLEKAKEMHSLIEQPTMELKAEENKRLAMESQERKKLERQNQVNLEIGSFVEKGNWEMVAEEYFLAEEEEICEITVNFLARNLVEDDDGDYDGRHGPSSLPPFSEKIFDILMKFLECSSIGDLLTLSSLQLLRVYTEKCENNIIIDSLRESRPLVSIVTHILCSINPALQCLCANILSNYFTHLPEDYSRPSDDATIIQPLLLVSHFSTCQEAKDLAVVALSSLRVDSRTEPDPGTWSVDHVSLWMESTTGIDKKCEYRKSFFDAGIDGLHLLELSSAEMTGLGVKFVSHQRKLSDLVDDLRRRNMRSMVGKKDIFLSYAHIDIKFARNIKKVLNQEDYSVWIDEAGIRVGHKWRNEIADGIKDSACLLFIMTPRSANSEYCQDEIALAEEYHKPILTIKYKDVPEMDPGLKLIVQRRQWINFTSESSFQADRQTLIDGVYLVIGEGSGLEEEVACEPPEDQTHHENIHSPSSNHITSPTTDHMFYGDIGDASGGDTAALRQLVREVVVEEFKRVREGTGSEALREMVREMVAEEIDRMKYTMYN